MKLLKHLVPDKKTRKKVALVASAVVVVMTVWSQWWPLMEEGLETTSQPSASPLFHDTSATFERSDPQVLSAVSPETQLFAERPDLALLEAAVIERVVDGDTVVLEDGRRLRYIGIDAPETVHPNQEAGCYGAEASARNSELVEGREIFLEKDVGEVDRYGRLLRYVWLDEVMINELLVADGYAFSSSFPPDIGRQEELRQAQNQASQALRGLWSSCQLDTPSTGCVIKGNVSGQRKLYHLPECPSYDSVIIEVSKGQRWFCSEEEALEAGWVKAGNC